MQITIIAVIAFSIVIGAAAIWLVGDIPDTVDYTKEESASKLAESKLPASCDKVRTTETWLYPTGEQCIDEINQRFYDWCHSDSDDVDSCVSEIKDRIVRQCQDSALGAKESCEMSTMKYFYQNMIPK